MRKVLALLTAILVLGALNACVKRPTKLVEFGADNTRGNSAIFVTIDMVFTKGTQAGGTTYPHEWIADKLPFQHFQGAEVGTVIHMSITAVPSEPGQIVTCYVTIDGVEVDAGRGTYPKGVVCLGPAI